MTLKNLDTEKGGYYVSSVSGDTDETGKTASFTVRLRSQPTDNITIYVASSDTSEGTVSADNLSFTTTNWNADQTVTITGLRTIFPTATSPTRSVWRTTRRRT